MKHGFPILALTSLFVLLAVPAVAADPEPAEPVASGQAGAGEPQGGSAPNLDVNQAELLEKDATGAPAHTELAEPEGRAVSPLMEDINRVVAESTVRLAELQGRLDREIDDRAALEIVRAMEQVKIRTELDILAVQADHARQNGREDLAQEIEGAITEMTAPRPLRHPVDRPAPDAGNR
ncbi:MAG: hypothetical protein ABR506_05875 [Candidatus Krumholzibacteriia bacterium]